MGEPEGFDIKDILKRYSEKFGDELWSALNVKRYRPVAGYPNPARLSLSLHGMIKHAEESRKLGSSKVETNLAGAIACIVRDKMPTYHISNNLIDSLVDTDLPDMTYDEVNWPLPSGLFLLAKDPYRKTKSPQPTALIFGIMPHNEVVLLPGKNFALKSELGDKISIASLPTQFGLVKPTVADTESQGMCSCELSKEKVGSMSEIFDNSLDSEEVNAAFEMQKLVVKIALLMAARPELIESCTQLRKSKSKKGKKVSELWEPYWVGRNYRRIGPPAEKLGGTHASPKLHWRKGHWRNQRFGPGRRDSKLKWIEPVLIGASD